MLRLIPVLAITNVLYIAFNGSVSATVTYPEGSSCQKGSFGPHIKSYLYVGMNLPWDSNPFFFKLYHKSTEDGGFITFTDDEIYGLDFGSPAYACWDDSGNPCGYYETSWEDLPEILLNLTTATATKTKVGGEEGYEVTGDETTYVQNTKEGASYNRVNVYDSCDELGLDFTDAFIWNDTFKWSYKIGLSNSTGSATIRSEIKGATLEITYTGERMTNSSMWLNVELVASDDSEPQFQFSNDSNIYFSEGISGKWSAAATPLPSGANPAGATFPTGTLHSSDIQLSSTGVAAPLRMSRPLLAPLLAFGATLAF